METIFEDILKKLAGHAARATSVCVSMDEVSDDFQEPWI
jgi:hypothetical protein